MFARIGMRLLLAAALAFGPASPLLAKDLASSVAAVVSRFGAKTIANSAGYVALTPAQMKQFLGNTIAVLELNNKAHKTDILFMHYFSPKMEQFRQRFGLDRSRNFAVAINAIGAGGQRLTHGFSEGWIFKFSIEGNAFLFPDDGVTKRLEIYAKGDQLACRYGYANKTHSKVLPCYEMAGNNLMVK